ncbi:hypothetical protein GCM10025857_24200 [Alicyclobacillus contaminans]|uniref:hypothetical protein n=1 Tax=Alicyclobacillus contaminans TaxID=392016 RepID=UPI000479114B|nr:hypothetical protein [Alicyclobacillus contaminans]GMA51063.1 hypothetical protein GCM10025857_24200 [Alicyclobacillus contaminans]
MHLPRHRWAMSALSVTGVASCAAIGYFGMSLIRSHHGNASNIVLQTAHAEAPTSTKGSSTGLTDAGTRLSPVNAAPGGWTSTSSPDATGIGGRPTELGSSGGAPVGQSGQGSANGALPTSPLPANTASGSTDHAPGSSGAPSGGTGSIGSAAGDTLNSIITATGGATNAVGGAASGAVHTVGSTVGAAP